MPYNILIVDDDRIFRSEFGSVLKEEYNVFEAPGGAEAIDIIKKPNMIDLVILDVRMPGIHGTEVLHQLKQLEPNLSIIMLTGYSSRDVIIDSLRKHADDFLEKPVKMETAIKRIKLLLDGKQLSVKGPIEKLKFFIEKNFHKEISLKEASEIVCLSPKHISRMFKKETGIGFNQYKLKLKIEWAKQLLDEHEYNINEIASMTGYQNVESFIRIFKKLAGLTPSSYRQIKAGRKKTLK